MLGSGEREKERERERERDVNNKTVWSTRSERRLYVGGRGVEGGGCVVGRG